MVLAKCVCMQFQRVRGQWMALLTIDGRGFVSKIIHFQVNYSPKQKAFC